MDDDSTQRQAARMAMVGALAKPVQHDANNMLTVVFANLDMLKRSAAEGAPQRQLDRVQQAMKRLEALLRAMLSLTRREAGEVTAPLSKMIEALQPLLAVLLPAPGALTVTLDAAEQPVRLDRVALDSALVALAFAARDALPKGAGIVLTTEGDALNLSWPGDVSLPTDALLACGAATEREEDGRHILRLRFPAAA